MRFNKRRYISMILLFIMLVFLTMSLIGCAKISKSLANEESLNLDGYELVMCDEFEGEFLDLSVWKHRGVGPRRDGYNSASQVKVANGNLIINGEYINGEFGEGWYAGAISLLEEYTYGYFEIRCIPNERSAFWSAFWLQSKNSYSHEDSQGGVNGAEIDIFESYSTNLFKNSIRSNIYCNGYDDDVENYDQERVATVRIPNMRSDYTTFGLNWTEEEYVFYINGIETGRSSFGYGTSKDKEEVIVSLEIPERIRSNKKETTSFIVDYVKIYQRAK